MILHSTNRQSPPVDFATAITRCVAPDGGIYIPEHLTRLPHAFYDNIAQMSLPEIGYVVINTLLSRVVPSPRLKRIADEVLTFDVPLHKAADNTYVMELFHGPSMSFKDFGARFMASLLNSLSPAPATGRTVILATSGDCGGAVAQAFSGVANTNVCVLYPRNVLSREQYMQFATVPNAQAVEVDGSFDRCQQMIRSVLKGYDGPRQLVWGNSTNVARQLPAVVYFFYAYAQAVRIAGPKARLVISVPCGNLGNLTAALMAKKMGLPIHRIVAACGTNDAVARYLDSGVFTPEEGKRSLSGPLCVGNPLNMERIVALCGGSPDKLAKEVEAITLPDEAISHELNQNYRTCHYLMEPQTALALAALKRSLAPGETGISLGCTHPAKCAPVILKEVNVMVPTTNRLAQLARKPHNHIKIPATAAALKRVLSNMN